MIQTPVQNLVQNIQTHCLHLRWSQKLGIGLTVKGRAKTRIAVPGLVEGVGDGNRMIFKELSNPKPSVIP